MNTDTLHFRVGADMGLTLMRIANEHIIYNMDVDKALKCFTDSFGGDVPEELVLQLLTGEQIVLVDEEEQMFNVVPRKNHMHLDKIYPKLDLLEFLEAKEEEMQKLTDGFDQSLDIVIDKLRYRKDYRIDFSIDAVVAYLYGDDEVMHEEIRDDYELNRMETVIRLTRDFIEKSMKLQAMFRRLGAMYGMELELDTYEFLNLVEKVKSIAKMDFHRFNVGGDQTVTDYLEATMEIDKAVRKGLEPVDIMANYSAGWLSPEGDYYALNGEIANMLHNQISVALQEQGIIPDSNDEFGDKINPDSWLEQEGWVKIHTDNINFGGCLNHKLPTPKDNVHMTETQKKLIYEYIQICHSGIVRLGWKMEKVSAARFQMTDDLMLAKHFFSFD